MLIILPNLKHSFISPVPVPVPDLDFRVFHTPLYMGLSFKLFHLLCHVIKAIYKLLQRS